MNVRFKHNNPQNGDKVFIEQVFAEKPGGGLVKNQTYDVSPTTAVGEENGLFVPIKAYRLKKAVANADDTIEIEKGSGIVSGDFIGYGKKAVACTKVDTSNKEKDVVTVSLGLEIPIGEVLYQAKSANNTNAEPIVKPIYVTGAWVFANEGDQSVRLLNGANLRKETANVSSEVVALLPNITLV